MRRSGSAGCRGAHASGDSAIDDRGRLVGREAELAHLDRWLDEVLAGHSQPLLLEGEPGIGKTSLLRAARAGAIRAGARPLAVTPIPAAASLALAGLGAVIAPLRAMGERLEPGAVDALRARTR